MASEAALGIVNSASLQARLVHDVIDALKSDSAKPRSSSKSAAVARSSQPGPLVFPELHIHKLVVEAVRASLEAAFGTSGSVLVLRADIELGPVMAKVMAQVPHAVLTRGAAATEARLDALVDVYLPTDPLAKPMAEIERDNAEAQARFIETVKCHSAEDLAELAGHEAANRSATATRWKMQGSIFSVRRLGRDRYPAFQFQDGRPRRVIGKILKTLPGDMSPWQIALWFSTPNGWLEGAKPMERLADEAAVIAAAAHEGDDWQG